jgi:hypothetical protein
VRVRKSVGAVLALVLLAGCGGGGPEGETGQTAEQAADVLAASLSQGTVEGIEIRTGDPEKDIPEIFAGMGGMRPEVTVAHVRHAGESALVDLAYSWPLSSRWTYETEAIMVQDGDEWELHWKPDIVHPRLTENTRLERVRGEASERGNITGRGNTLLVQNLPMQLLGLNKTGLEPAVAEDSARRIADELSINADTYAAKVKAAPPGAFVDAVPVRPNEVTTAFKRIRGAQQRTVTLPAAKTTGYARALLGTVGYATEKQAQAAVGIVPGDIVGTSGLQQTYDRELRGSTGNKVFIADRSTAVGQTQPRAAAMVADFPDVPGQSLSTTIDDDIQTAAEKLLGDMKVPASVVVLRKDNGEILAAADSPLARRNNDSIESRIAPGLAAGPVAALALMRSGVNLSEEVTCEKEVVIDGRRFDNGEDFSGDGKKMTIAEAIAENCVTAVAQTATRVDPEKVTEAARTLGLATNYNLGILLNFGDYPAPSDAVAKAEALVGEGGRGKVHVSPAALAAMAATVDEKRTIVPFIVPGRDPQAGEGIPALTDAEQDELQDLMKDGPSGYGQMSEVSTGEADERAWAVGSTDTLAIAVVLHDNKSNYVTPAQIVRTVTNASSIR